MRDTSGKIENGGATPAGQLGADEHNDVILDIIDNVNRSGQVINAADTSQTSESSTIHSMVAPTFTVDGTSTSNNLILVPISGTGGVKIPLAPGTGGANVYNRLNGAVINFRTAVANTGPVTINLGQDSTSTIGSKKLLDSEGVDLTSGDLTANTRVECQYDSTADSGTGAWLFTTAAFVQSDWNQTNTAEPDFIRNKPISFTPSGPAGGDLGGTYPDPTVDGLQGRTVSSLAPTDGQVLTWNNAGSDWRPQTSGLPSGTVMLFGQNSAPTGWTRLTTWANNAMLVYRATGNVATGGTVDPRLTHSHSMQNHVHSTANHTLTLAQIPSHTHNTNIAAFHTSGEFSRFSWGGPNAPGNLNTLAAGGGGAHNHGNTGTPSVTNTGGNTGPLYQQVIAATKD